MELLVAYQKDPAGYNIAKFISKELEKNDHVYKGKDFDLAIISSPAISADWLEEKFDYDGYIFLSKHAAESGVLALRSMSSAADLLALRTVPSADSYAPSSISLPALTTGSSRTLLLLLLLAFAAQFS